MVKLSYISYSNDYDDDNEPTECARFGGPTAATKAIERSNRDHRVDRVMTRSDYLVLVRSPEVRAYFDPLISDIEV